MSKKYGLSGVGTNVEFGKAGQRIKDTGSNLAVRNAADDALAVLEVAEGTSGTHAVTKDQLDAIGTGILFRSLALANDSSATENIGATVTGTAAFRWQVNVTTAFDGTSPTLELGVSGTTSAITPSSEIDLTSIGQYTGICHLDVSGLTQMIATYAADSSTAGAALIIVEWI